MKEKEMTIRELSTILQNKIDVSLESFVKYNDKLKAMTLEMEGLEKKMIVIIEDLEPVESLIYNQNPQLKRIFESLKRIHGKGENGIDSEVN